MPDESPKLALWKVLLLALLPLIGYWTYGLFDIDEGFYGAVTAEMNRRGEWITPYYQGQPWFEKPILLYWFAKPGLMLFGPEFGLRLPSLLASLAFCAYLFRFSNRHFGPTSGFKVVIVLASSLLWSLLARQMMTDVFLVGCLTAALLLLWESFTGGWWLRLASGALIGVGVLAKGPVAIILFAPVAIYGICLASRTIPFKFSRELLGWGSWLMGVIAIAATWYVPAYLVNGQVFIQKFLIEQNLNRFTGGDIAHTLGPQSLLLFVPVLLVGMAPWSFFVPKAWPRKASDPLLKFIAAGALIPFLFFSASGAKLPHYILPCVPMLVLLVGNFFAGKEPRELGWRMGTVSLIAISLLLNIGMPIYYRVSGHAEIHGLARQVATQTGPVYAFQMPRREADRGTGKPKLQETSHPSLTVYVGRECTNIEAIEAHNGELWVRRSKDSGLEPAGTEIWMLTRTGRLTPEIVGQLRDQAFVFHVQEPVGNYQLSRIHRAER